MGKLTKLFIGCTAIGIAAATAYYFMERNAESEIPAADIDDEAPEAEAKTEEKDNFIDKATRTYTTVVSFIADSAEKVMDYLDRDEEDEFDPEEEPEEETAEEALEAAEEVKEAAEDAAADAKEAVEDAAADAKEAARGSCQRREGSLREKGGRSRGSAGRRVSSHFFCRIFP